MDYPCAGEMITELPLDMMRQVIGQLDPNDIASLLDVSDRVREKAISALPPQERLWAAAMTLTVEQAKIALDEGARVNKLNPTCGENALKMVEGRDAQFEDLLTNRGAKAFNQESLNKELRKTIGTRPDGSKEVDPSVALVRVIECIYDGADMYANLHYGIYQPYSSFDLVSHTFEKMDIMKFAICKAKIQPTVYIPWIKALLESGYDVNKPACGVNDFGQTPLMDAMDFYRTGPFYINLDEVMNPQSKYDPDGDPFTNFNATTTMQSRDLYFSNLDKFEVLGSRTAITKVLLDAPNADVNAQSSGFEGPDDPRKGKCVGLTALHLLCSSRPRDKGLRKENVALARLLLEAGADVSIKAVSGLQLTALDMARKIGDDSMINVLT